MKKSWKNKMIIITFLQDFKFMKNVVKIAMDLKS